MPQRLAVAREVVGHIWPAGTYARFMEGTFDKIMDSVMGSMLDMPTSQVVGGLATTDKQKADLANIGDKPMREVMAAADPHYRERMQIMMRVMGDEMTPIMTRMEPVIQEALAIAYARRFDEAQLRDLARYFATPTGAAYARESMLVFMDPAMIEQMTQATPEIMKAMPAIMSKVTAATAHLPPPPKPKTDGE